MLHTTENVIRHKIGLLNLAEELDNVSKACKIMGVSRDTFYRYKEAVEDGGVEALIEESRRKPNPKNRTAPEVEQAILELPPRLLEELRDLLEPPQEDTAVFEGPAMGGVDADDQRFLVPEYGLELGTEVPLVGTQGVEESFPEPIQRHVVIARHDQRGGVDLIDEIPRPSELLRLGSLGQISGDHHQIGLPLGDESEDPGSELRQMGWPEVDVRDVTDLAHVGPGDPPARAAALDARPRPGSRRPN